MIRKDLLYIHPYTCQFSKKKKPHDYACIHILCSFIIMIITPPPLSLSLSIHVVQYITPHRTLL